MKRKITFLVVAVLCLQTLLAQNKTIRGTIVDSFSEPIIGASAHVKGTYTGTISDLNGNYTLENVPEDAVITFSYIGMIPQEIAVKGKNVINVQLKDDVQKLEEVVVIGYGSAKAKDLTSPITVVKGEALLSTPASSPMAAMQGKVAGVNVTNSGTPGEGPKVAIRGKGSFSNSSPLYVVDGMFYDDINFLNSNDIQDMSVLKDASAAAIYGVRAANGVVIITTKKGQRNQKAKITYNGYIGVQKATNVLEMANSQEYSTMLLEANYDAYVSTMKASIDKFGGDYSDPDFHNWKFDSDTDWYKELLRSALITNHSLGISGGTEKSTYSVGMSYLYQDGVMDVENNYKRLNFRAALDYEAANWLKVGFNGVFSNSTQVLPQNKAWQQAFNAPGIYPVYDPANDNTFPDKYASPDAVGFTANFYNPVATANYYDSQNENYQVLTNFYAQFQLLPEKLNFRTSYSYDYSAIRGREYIAPYYVSSWQQQAVSELTKKDTNYYNYIWDNILTYNNQWGKHNFGAMLGYSMRQQQYRYMWGKANNVPEGKDEWLYLSQGNAEGVTLGDDGYCYRGQSYFTRLSYDYAGKYLLTFTMRADGSSKFSKDNRWGTFPSLALGWKIKEENFLKDVNVLSDLKLRLGWGITGQQNIGDDFAYLPLYVVNNEYAQYPFGDTYYSTSRPKAFNENLKWEKTTTWNAGLDFGFLNGRITGGIDGYFRKTDDLLNSVKIPVGTNFNAQMTQNIGSLENYGMEFSINAKPIVTKDFTWDLSYNITWNHNEITKLTGGDDSDYYVEAGDKISRGNNTKVQANKVGYAANSFYVYQQVYDENGKPIENMFVDRNGNGTIDSGDKYIYKKPAGDVLMGLTSKMQYKNFDFSFSLRASLNNYVYYDFLSNKANVSTSGLYSNNAYSNTSAEAVALGFSGQGDYYMSDYFIHNASFLRCDNITLGYSFQNLWKGQTYKGIGGRVYATVQNPFIISKYKGLDPEVKSGIDANPYPRAMTFLLGLSLQF